tara:strand:+ start:157 stop:411 length:255 start_codon:yes stop_codon:yes gene_type:complete
MKKETKDNKEEVPSGITRKDAILKMGKYAALTAMGTFMILNPQKAQASSSNPSISGDGGGSGDGSGSDGGGRESGSPPNPPGWD